MAKARRQFTDEDKAKVLAHMAEHGLKVTSGHFNIVGSVLNRWRRQAGMGAQPPRLRRWTPAKKAKVLEYLKTHSHTDTRKHFGISGAQIHIWRHNLPQGYYGRKPKANGATNGLGVLEMEEKDALMWLERWRTAYFDRMKAETPSATSVLQALRGGK